MISILISTKNRSKALRTCLQSILLSSYQNFEILLFDQSNDDKTEKIVHALRSKKISYVKMRQSGKSKALNLALQKAKSEILAFTDDDCIVDKFWLAEIVNFFKSHPNTAGVFGNTYPYNAEEHPYETCPATFHAEKVSAHSDPSTVHYQRLGQGNNMSLRKSVIEEAGCFKEWLGVGSITYAGEESDLIFRIFLNNHILMTNPKMIVYHNRWLTRKQENIQQSHYTCGLMAFFGYYLLSNNRAYSQRFIAIKLSERVVPIFKKILHLAQELIKEVIFLFLEIVAVIKGICIGLLMAIIK